MGAGRGRGGVRVGGGGGGGCFQCGQQGHFSRECPQGGGGGGYHQRRGGYGGGGGGGRGRGRRGGRFHGNAAFKGVMKAERFHDTASESLLNVVEEMNEIDVSGPMEVRVVEFVNGWQLIDSLSTGIQYFYKPRGGDSLPAKTSRSVPAECREESAVREERSQPQGSTFAKPPDPALYSRDLRCIPLQTNAYTVSGEFLNNTVHSYLVDFDPPLKNCEVLERRRVVIGTTSSEQRRNRKLLDEKFGNWTFNNNFMYSIGARPHKTGQNDELKLSENYRTMFRWNDSSTINSTDLELTEEEQLLNTFNKKALKDAGFKQVRRSWFYHNVTSPPPELSSIRPSRINNQCTILHGFDCRMTLNHERGHENDKRGMFKADLANKQISTKTVHDIIADIGMDRQFGSDSFRKEVQRQLVGKFFIMNYNSVSQKIQEIDFGEDEHSTFENRLGAKVSYGKYLKVQYGITVRKKECCVLKDRCGSAFLPQFAYLTLRSDEIEQDLRDAIQKHTNPGIAEQLQRVQGLVRCLNKSEQQCELRRQSKDGGQTQQRADSAQQLKKKRASKEDEGSHSQSGSVDQALTEAMGGLTLAGDGDGDGDGSKDGDHDGDGSAKTVAVSAAGSGSGSGSGSATTKSGSATMSYGLRINEQCVRTNAVVLNYPNITFMAFGGREKTVPLHPEHFRWGGREGTKGFLGQVRQLKNWVIVSDNPQAVGKVHETYEAYLRMRSFDALSGPLLAPDTRILDFNDAGSFREIAARRYQLIFVCLPDDKFGSEVKTRLTKALQSATTTRHQGCHLQCIQQSTVFMARSKDAILGAFEQMMGKFGNILYRITPSIPPQSPYIRKLDRIWTIGIDISHGGNVKGVKGGSNRNPSVSMLCLQTLPFCGTQRGLRNFSWLNTARKDVIPYAATATMTIKVLSAEIDRIRDPKTRPEIIMVFRDGAPDNALKEIHSKELVGVQRGVYEIRNVLKEKHHIVWKPKIQFLVVSKDPIEKFGVENRGRVEALTEPAVVFSGITSSKLWDFFIWGYHPNCSINKIKPKRFVVLKDELKLGDLNKAKGGEKGGKRKRAVVNGAGSNGPMGLYEIIFALSFTYHPSLPFIQGGTSQPAPITFAKHFAEKFSQLITAQDTKIDDLCISRNLTNQPQIVSALCPLSQKLPDEKKERKKERKEKRDGLPQTKATRKNKKAQHGDKNGGGGGANRSQNSHSDAKNVKL